VWWLTNASCSAQRIHDDAIHLLLRSTTDLQRLNLSFMDISDKAFTTEPSDQRNGFYAMGRALRAIDLTQSSITDASLFALAKHCPLQRDHGRGRRSPRALLQAPALAGSDQLRAHH
jgi:hypothetical protein